MTGAELQEAQSLIRRASRDAQAVLDVLTAATQAGEIRKSRLAVSAGLIRVLLRVDTYSGADSPRRQTPLEEGFSYET